MAFKAYGVGDFSRTVNGVTTVEPGTVAKYSTRARVTVDGVNFTPKRKVYPGQPTPAMLKANNLNVQTLAGRPWPGSAGDRLAKAPPDAAVRVGNDGEPVRLAGPNAILQAQRDGLWPDDEEKRLQAIAEAKLANPEEAAVRMLMAQGIENETKARGIAKQKLFGIGNVDLSDLAPKAKPAAPAAPVKPGKEL